ncbi:low temperature requirement protein A [Nonomuraea indica]|uniref:Low temperature requirement protein A n=1 Tax=Nonomuraea indica TaxID=1581193 RepID=A0ABW8A4W3_9ACTN
MGARPAPGQNQHAVCRLTRSSRGGDCGSRSSPAYGHIPIAAGIIVAVVGDELAIAHPLGPVSAGTALTVLGGPALFLAGTRGGGRRRRRAPGRPILITRAPAPVARGPVRPPRGPLRGPCGARRGGW